MKPNTMPLSRSILGACGLTSGAYCALSAFWNGQSLAHDNTGYVFGAAFVALVVASWFLLHLADGWRKAGEPMTAALITGFWVLLMAFTLTNAVTFTASTRTEHVGEKVLTIEAYNRAKETRATALADLATVKTNPRWIATNGCTNATNEKSKQFCNGVTMALGQLKIADTTLASGKPASADAGAETLAWVIDGDSSKVARGLPVFMAIVSELAASLLMKLALKSPGARRFEIEAVKLKPVETAALMHDPRSVQSIEKPKPKAITVEMPNNNVTKFHREAVKTAFQRYTVPSANGVVRGYHCGQIFGRAFKQEIGSPELREILRDVFPGKVRDAANGGWSLTGVELRTAKTATVRPVALVKRVIRGGSGRLPLAIFRSRN